MRIAFAVACAVVVSLASPRAQAPAARPGPWFGLTLPGAVTAPAVRVGARAPRPVLLPPGEGPAAEFDGVALKADVATIVRFAHDSGERREVGNGQMWGRIAGFPSSDRTVAWAADQFRQAGLTDVRIQPIAQDPRASLWLPLTWQVKVLANQAFGAGSADLVLQSALPVGPSVVPGGTMTAPLVYVGTASPAVLRHIDVKGKIAVQLVVPQGHMLFERGAVDARSEALVKAGAVGVFNLVRLPGNELSRDFNDCGNPCFNIGGRDGWFLEALFERATAAGVHDQLRVQIDLTTETFRGLKATNAVAVIPGVSAEAIVLNAHVDGWFDGAGDNADGLAVLVALARHYARAGTPPARTIVFVASAGHHTPGINGPRSFVAANPDLANQSVMFINIEHVAQRNFSPARTTSADGYREAVADSGEAPIAVGVTNNAPFLQTLIDAAPARYGVNFISERSTFQSGETGGWADLKVAKVSVMQAPPLYHTTGEVLDAISAPGLERIARFLASFVTAAAGATRAELNP